MPPLSSMSISSHQPQSPPGQGYQSPSPYFNQPAPPTREPVHSPVEARIQSWADNLEPQQPRPMPPIAPVWSPNMGIKFAGTPPVGGAGKDQQGGQQQSGGNGPVAGTWEPGKGIRFG